MKNKKSFWDSSFRLMSDVGREVISDPILSKRLIEMVRKKRRGRGHVESIEKNVNTKIKRVLLIEKKEKEYDLDDIEYFKKRLFESLMIPPRYLNGQ
jgi:hypothetical protein